MIRDGPRFASGWIYQSIHQNTDLFGDWPLWRLATKGICDDALEYLRKYDALRSSAPIDEYGEQVEDVDASVLDRLSADDYWNASPGCHRLPDCLQLYAIEGYTHKEIAAMLHIQEITSRSQFARARKALQEMVQSLIAQDNVSRNRT